jgi:hypothetical protein
MLSKQEEKLINDCIAAYKRTIKHIRKQIKVLESQKGKDESR